jgi:hypothetical protein
MMFCRAVKFTVGGAIAVTCSVYGRFALLAAVDLPTESPLLDIVYGPEIPIGFNVVIPG